MLNPSDVYVEGGTDDLRVCWTDKVTKYDASSFYNWEMDNLPLHDLDERTTVLWEKLGHPTSALTGMSFVVSGDATSSCYPTYFVDLSTCLNALPEVINCPILVEVASFGNLGRLELSNKSFGPLGSLEIINRNCGFAGGVDLAGETMSQDVLDATWTDYSLVSSVSSLDDADLPSIVYDIVSATLYVNGNSIADSTGQADARYVNPYVFTRRVDSDQLVPLSVGLSSTETPWTTATMADARKNLNFTPYDGAAANRTADSMNAMDASTVSELDGTTTLYPLASQADNKSVAAFAYFNSLEGIKVTNCNGPLYIRNFTVDGEKTRDRGIEIVNSTVNLERCAATRCKEAGLFADNSDVKLLRGFVSFRNYGFDDDGNRIGVDWNFKVDNEQTQTLDVYGAGIYAENSTIDFKETYARDVEKSSQASADVYTGSVNDLPHPSLEALYCLSRNDIGLHALNSVIKGGRPEYGGSGNLAWRDGSQVISELNTEAGVRLENCSLEVDGRLTTYGNFRGFDAYNSTLKVDCIKAYANQKEGLRLTNSDLTYNNKVYLPMGGITTFATQNNTYAQQQVTLVQNGTALKAVNSQVKPVYTSAMGDYYLDFWASGSHGVNQGTYDADHNTLPAISLDNSVLDAIQANIHCETNGSPVEPCYGQAISAKNGSKVYLRGTDFGANRVVGQPDTGSIRKAGIFVENGSKVSIQGPTVIAQFGVGLLAENNSTIEVCPHKNDNGTLMVSAFELENANSHTMVELHATRACMVAKNNSTINLEDLGSYYDEWQNLAGGYAEGLDLGRLDYLTSSENGSLEYLKCVSGGHLQFYANVPLDNETDIPFDVWTTAAQSAARDFTNSTHAFQGRHFLFDIDDEGEDFDISAVTTGGYVVRAINNSIVNVRNVHFPCGWPQTSSTIYDFSGLGDDSGKAMCYRPPIWNIADNSHLNAGYLSISGVHPRDAGHYVGPSGNWFLASAYPDSTPDTSSLSLLDYYGADGDNQNLFGQTTAKNFGPFRLFFSVDPVVNYLVDPVDALSGYPSQIYAQGYQWSGALSAPGTVSAEYTQVLFGSSVDSLSDAGFWFASALVTDPDSVKATLDDSAANAFCNAKHNSVGKSGLAKVVKIYEPFKTGFGGDSNIDTTRGYGIGSVNNFDLEKDN